MTLNICGEQNQQPLHRSRRLLCEKVLTFSWSLLCKCRLPWLQVRAGLPEPWPSATRVPFRIGGKRTFGAVCVNHSGGRERRNTRGKCAIREWVTEQTWFKGFTQSSSYRVSSETCISIHKVAQYIQPMPQTQSEAWNT